ncbi:hypothetical protein JCM24511_04405 [Saitozyma sp. JCM 24511]|nr:hypothetical protein JCM24511_04405 [Saitozyma sp. JCM 24511]
MPRRPRVKDVVLHLPPPTSSSSSSAASSSKPSLPGPSTSTQSQATQPGEMYHPGYGGSGGDGGPAQPQAPSLDTLLMVYHTALSRGEYFDLESFLTPQLRAEWLARSSPYLHPAYYVPQTHLPPQPLPQPQYHPPPAPSQIRIAAPAHTSPPPTSTPSQPQHYPNISLYPVASAPPSTPAVVSIPSLKRSWSAAESPGPGTPETDFAGDFPSPAPSESPGASSPGGSHKRGKSSSLLHSHWKHRKRVLDAAKSEWGGDTGADIEPLSGIGGVVSGTATPVPPATPTTAQEKGHGGRKKEEEVDRDSVQEGASYWNHLLIQARKARGPQWDYNTQQHQVDRQSKAYYTHMSKPNTRAESPAKQEAQAEASADSKLPLAPPMGTSDSASKAGLATTANGGIAIPPTPGRPVEDLASTSTPDATSTAGMEGNGSAARNSIPNGDAHARPTSSGGRPTSSSGRSSMLQQVPPRREPLPNGTPQRVPAHLPHLQGGQSFSPSPTVSAAPAPTPPASSTAPQAQSRQSFSGGGQMPNFSLSPAQLQGYMGAGGMSSAAGGVSPAMLLAQQNQLFNQAQVQSQHRGSASSQGQSPGQQGQQGGDMSMSPSGTINLASMGGNFGGLGGMGVGVGGMYAGMNFGTNGLPMSTGGGSLNPLGQHGQGQGPMLSGAAAGPMLGGGATWDFNS